MVQCRLTEKIAIEEYSSYQDSEGFDVAEWIPFHNCWCNFRSVSGKEYISAKATQSENIVTFTVRYCRKSSELLKKDSTKKYRIKHKDKTYNIEYVYDYENLHNWIDIKCTATN